MIDNNSFVLKLITSKDAYDDASNEKEINMLSACSALIKNKICINFIMMYLAYEIPAHEHDLKKADIGVEMLLNKIISPTTSPFKPVTYGILMERIDTDVIHCHALRAKETNWNKIFWQIAMALMTIRKHLGYFHNDSHGGNIFLTKVLTTQAFCLMHQATLIGSS